MARTFAGGSDRVVFPAKATSTTFSILFWLKNPATVGDHVAFSWVDRMVLNFISSNCPLDLDFAASRAGKWTASSAQHGMTLANWNHVAWTHDSSNVANNPTLYCNGVSKALTENVAPTVAFVSGSTIPRIGCYTNDALSIGGTLAYFSIHNVVLTQGEVIEAMHYGFTPRGLTFLVPLWGDTAEMDLIGRLSGTVTGATVSAGPPVRYGLMPPPGYGNSYVVDVAPPAGARPTLMMTGVGS